MTSNEKLLSLMIFVMGLLAAGFMYAMFRGGPFDSFEMSRLYFAAGTLVVIAWIFILSMIFYLLAPNSSPEGGPGKAIFDSCVKIIPPIATLIIGFYFGVHSGAPDGAPSRRSSAPTAASSGGVQASAPTR